MIRAVVNFKGGVGKTTTAVTLAALFADSGTDTLLIDSDPQGNATRWIAPEGVTRGLEDVIDRTARALPTYPTAWSPHLRVTPASDQLAGAVHRMPITWKAQGPENALVPALSPYATSNVLIDCGPNRSLLTIAILRVAHQVLITTLLEPMAVEGNADLVKFLRGVRDLNGNLRLAGILPVAYSRSNLAEALLARLQEVFGKAVLPPVRRTVRVGEAYSHRQPLHRYAPTSTAALDYQTAFEALTTEGYDVP